MTQRRGEVVAEQVGDRVGQTRLELVQKLITHRLLRRGGDRPVYPEHVPKAGPKRGSR